MFEKKGLNAIDLKVLKELSHGKPMHSRVIFEKLKEGEENVKYYRNSLRKLEKTGRINSYNESGSKFYYLREKEKSMIKTMLYNRWDKGLIL